MALKVVFLVANDLLQETGYSTRVLSQLEILSKNQDELSLVLLYFASWRELCRPRVLIALMNRLHRLSIRMYIAPFPPDFKIGLLQLATSFWAATICYLVLKVEKSRIIHAHATRAGFIAALLKNFHKKLYVVFDKHGIGPEEIALYWESKGVTTRRYFDKVAMSMKIEKYCLARANRIVCVSSRMSDYLSTKYHLSTSRFSVVPCAVNTDVFFYNEQDRIQVRQDLGLNSRLTIIYCGGFQSYQLVPQMVQLFETIKRICTGSFFLILSGDDPEIINRDFSRYHFDKSQYKILSITHARVAKYIQAADVGILLRENILVNNVASPTKFAEYLACGIPVATSLGIGDYSDAVVEHNLGIPLDPHADDNWPTALEPFLQSIIANREEFAKRCSRYAISYLSWQKHAQTLRDIYVGSVHKPHTPSE